VGSILSMPPHSGHATSNRSLLGLRELTELL
jgi:hypothetical protein